MAWTVVSVWIFTVAGHKRRTARARIRRAVTARCRARLLRGMVFGLAVLAAPVGAEVPDCDTEKDVNGEPEDMLCRMKLYRWTCLLDVEAALNAVEAHRQRLEEAGARFIDMVEDGQGTVMVVACYDNHEVMVSATVVANHVFSELIQDGFVEGDSLEIFSGDTRLSVPAAD